MENCTYGLYVEGRKSGLEEGHKTGFEEGHESGFTEGVKSTIMKMLKKRYSNDAIIDLYPDYDNDKLDQMRKEIEDENNRKWEIIINKLRIRLKNKKSA